MRLRTENNRLKIEHSILDGVRAMLNRLLRDRDDIRSIVPGRIAIVRDARGPVKVRVTVPVTNGWKAIALSDGARQELFISTTMDRDALETALKKAAEDA
ncbi:MAG: hypothetical protein FJW38_17320 [Acidobacteria bacterium]|nr:hypothetical protein [Acidobacteriota bacterium]MBM3766382.1 hypothetical protein [Acidobacteriota bacterium]